MKKWKKVATAALAAMVFASVLSGCGGDKKKAADAGDTIKVGASFELTGNVANYGKSILSGFKMAADEANQKGGVLGKKIAVVESDNKSEPSESGNSITKLVTQDKVVAVVGPATSGCVAAGAPITAANKIPHIAPSATAPGVTMDGGKVREFMFRACFIDPFQGQVMATFASNSLKVKNVAVLFDSSSDYSKGLAQVFQETLEGKGGKVVIKEAFLSKDMDFKSALTKIKATNPEAIYVPGYYEEVSKIIKQAREIGITCPLLGSDGWESPKLAEIAGKDALKDCYYVSAFSAQDKDPSVQKFIADYKAKYQKDPDIFALQGYNAGLVLFDAMKRANSTDGTKVAKAIAETKDLPIASGKMTFDANHNPIMPACIISLEGGVANLKEKISL
ncbi:ABC transporter substrate-binding protein [Phascolarctobacterium sp.]|uniref:ABC transporter substrate-binding protein n=1 Tax=Phascolarctobacterium sp. TaxID=2049039 RepID=UPI0038698F9B